jgi:hypothetical protein
LSGLKRIYEEVLRGEKFIIEIDISQFNELIRTMKREEPKKLKNITIVVRKGTRKRIYNLLLLYISLKCNENLTLKVINMDRSLIEIKRELKVYSEWQIVAQCLKESKIEENELKEMGLTIDEIDALKHFELFDY